MRFLRILATAALLGAAGCVSSGPRDTQSDQLDRADAEFLGGNYLSAAYRYDEFLKANPSTPRKAWVLFRIALCQSGAGKSDEALATFAKALAVPPDAALRLEILHRRAIVFNTKDDPKSALGDLLVIERAPKDQREKSVPTADFLKRLGVTAIRAGDWEGGRRWLSRLAEEFPQSREAAEVRPYIGLKALAIQVASTADASRAEAKVAEMKRSGHPARSVPGSTGFLILVGEFAKFEDAVRERDRLRREFPDCFIVP